MNCVPNSLLQMNHRRNFVPSLAYGMSPDWQMRFVISDGTMSSFLGIRTSLLALTDIRLLQSKFPVVVWKGQTVSVTPVWKRKNETDFQGLLGELSQLVSFGPWSWAGGTNENSLELSFRVIRRLCGDKCLFSKTIVHSNSQTTFLFFDIGKLFSLLSNTRSLIL